MAHIDRAPLKSPQYRMETTNTKGAPLQYHFFVYGHGLWFFNAFHENRRRFFPFHIFHNYYSFYGRTRIEPIMSK